MYAPSKQLAAVIYGAMAIDSMATAASEVSSYARNTDIPEYNPNGKVHMKNRKKRKIAKKSKRANRKK